MGQIHSVLGKRAQLCVRKASSFDNEMDEFGHTPKGRDAFAPLPRRKPSPCGRMPSVSLLVSGQNRPRLNLLSSSYGGP